MKEYRYSPDKYLNNLYERIYISPYDEVNGREACLAVSESLRKKLSDILAINNIPGKTEKLNPIVLKSENRGDYIQDTLSVEICQDWNMLCYLLTPKKPSKSAVIAVCGHSYGCRQIIRQARSGAFRTINFIDNYQKNFAIELAKRGNTVIVFEPVGFGEAKRNADAKLPFYSNSCRSISYHTLLYGLTTASLRIYQAMRCADILQDKGFKKIGCMGISGGGLVSLYFTCLDKRVSSAVVSGYTNTFKDSILSRWHCPDNYLPGIIRAGEIYDFASAVAPRRLLIEAGEKDKLFPIEGSKTAIERISRIYREVGALENLTIDVFNGKHMISGRKSFEFFNAGD